MRFAVLVGLSPILLTTSCYLPRQWKSAAYADSCVALDQPPPKRAQLFLTLRLPRCTAEGVELTPFRAQQIWYAARTGEGSGARIAIYRQDWWEAALEGQVKDAGRPPVIFIHGYNNSNFEALRRAALIAWALKGRYPVIGRPTQRRISTSGTRPTANGLSTRLPTSSRTSSDAIRVP